MEPLRPVESHTRLQGGPGKPADDAAEVFAGRKSAAKKRHKIDSTRFQERARIARRQEVRGPDEFRSSCPKRERHQRPQTRAEFLQTQAALPERLPEARLPESRTPRSDANRTERHFRAFVRREACPVCSLPRASYLHSGRQPAPACGCGYGGDDSSVCRLRDADRP